MAQTPGHILQDAFGDIRVEFIARDLWGMEVVNKGPWRGGGVGEKGAQVPRGYSLRKVGGMEWRRSPGIQSVRRNYGLKLRGSHSYLEGLGPGSQDWGKRQKSPGRLGSRPLRAEPGRRASSQSEECATVGPWSSGESPVPGRVLGQTDLSLCH